MSSTTTHRRPTAGEVETRSVADTIAADGKRIRGRIPYGVESRDLGGWREVVEPGALANTKFDDLIVTVDHVGLPLGRYPTTLELEDRADALHWSVDPPQSRGDVREAVERGDLRAGSWRMRVESDRWDGDVRHITAIAELRDVAIATTPAYPAAQVELRTEPTKENTTTMPTTTPAAETGTLRVEDRAAAVTYEPPRGLADEFRAAGFPGEVATIDWQKFEDRAITWTGSVDNIAKAQATAGQLGADKRWAWPAFTRQPVGADVTSVDVFTQTARTLATPATVVRNIDAVSAKPETASTLTLVTVPMKQVASIYTNVPNIQLEQPAFNTVIENDLTLAINGGLDKLVLDFIATCGFQAPGTDQFLVSVRKAMTTIMNNGYWPDTLLLTPVAAEALDILVSGITGGTNDYVFGPGNLAPNPFLLTKRIAKDIPASAVVDSAALGKMYPSPVQLARFEADAGTTNRGNVRLELNAVFGGERTAAGVRIAAA